MVTNHDDTAHSPPPAGARAAGGADAERHRAAAGPYRRFAWTILAASVAMYFVMYLDLYSIDHGYWSWSRLFMTMMSAATMTVIMMLFMRGMYPNKALNTVISLGAVAVFGAGLFLVRSQATVGDVAWMRAMIPHHSIAILTSERADIQDPRVRDLADSIIETQRREIQQMQTYINDLESR